MRSCKPTKQQLIVELKSEALTERFEEYTRFEKQVGPNLINLKNEKRPLKKSTLLVPLHIRRSSQKVLEAMFTKAEQI